MRDKLNDNPMAQLALVGLLLVVGVFMLLKPGSGAEESEEAPASGEVTATAESVQEPALEESAAGATGGVPTSIPVSPPPRRFSAAYDAGKTVVLLVVHDGGIDDGYTAAATSAVLGIPDTKLIVVPAAQIARYAAVTVGLDLSQVPALVVMKPKRLSHGVPQASVKYGFQTPQSVIQAVRDAAYKGPEATYHPD
ncbi:MAG TPA: hypothetical protein VFJ57_04940 [Solirubrobacterales bacterium]|nr:hypothetical protein [Solirubrobacterales bacterium]